MADDGRREVCGSLPAHLGASIPDWDRDLDTVAVAFASEGAVVGNVVGGLGVDNRDRVDAVSTTVRTDLRGR